MAVPLLGSSTSPLLLARHDGGGVREKSAVFGGTKSAGFVPPVEKDLHTQFHSELVGYILEYMRNVRN
jgi:hypothetical protein